MQKKVLAAVIGALLASPAVFADSANVVISGRFSAGFENYKVDKGDNAAPSASYNNEQRVSDQSSSLIFSGSEDLGGGLKGVFQMDTRFAADIGGNGPAGNNLFMSGNTFVGLAGGFGRIVFGRHDLHYNELFRFDASRSGSLQNWLSAGPFSQMNGNTIANGTRTPNVIMYDTNNLGGFTARVAYSTAWAGTEGSGVGATNGGKDAALTAAARWSAGPLALGLSYWDAKIEGEGATTNQQVGDQKSIRFWGGYTFPFGLTVALGVDNSERRQANAESMTDRQAIILPLRYTFGSETLHFSYATMDKVSGPNGGATTDNTGADAYAFGWDHALSKRTSFGVYYTVVDNEANASYDMFGLGQSGGTATAAGETAKQLYFGVAHTF